MEDVADNWEESFLALRGGESAGAGRLLSVDDPDSRGRPDDPPAASPTGEELALRFRRGNDQAFALLYERHRAPLLRFIRRTTPDPSDLEELVQDVWAAVIRGRERYMGRARFVTYLFSIARRRSADRWRRNGMELDPAVDANDLEALPAPVGTWPESRATTEAVGAAIASAVDALPLWARSHGPPHPRVDHRGECARQLRVLSGSGNPCQRKQERLDYRETSGSEQWVRYSDAGHCRGRLPRKPLEALGLPAYG